MLKSTKKLMQEYAQTLPACSSRAQCYTIANYSLSGKTIADRIDRDHSNSGHAKRAMRLMVEAGAAQEVNAKPCYYGTFVFEDGSEY